MRVESFFSLVKCPYAARVFGLREHALCGFELAGGAGVQNLVIKGADIGQRLLNRVRQVVGGKEELFLEKQRKLDRGVCIILYMLRI